MVKSGATNGGGKATGKGKPKSKADPWAAFAWGAPKSEFEAQPFPEEQVKPANAAAASGQAVPAASAGKKPKQEEQPPPFQDHFTMHENDGRGGCAFISVAQGLHNVAKTSRSPGPADFTAGGRAQAALRLLTSAEISRKAADDSDLAAEAKRLAEGGQAINSAGMRALVQATKSKIFIFR